MKRFRKPVPGALDGMTCSVTGDGQVSRDLAQKGAQTGRPRGRDTVPRIHPGVIEALLNILLDTQNIEGDRPAVPAIGIDRLCDRLFIPFPVKIDNFIIFHNASFKMKMPDRHFHMELRNAPPQAKQGILQRDPDRSRGPVYIYAADGLPVTLPR